MINVNNSFSIAIMGRPNVGKSTLFNRLSVGKKAIVSDVAGVTRDYQETPAQLGALAFSILDTAGVESDKVENIAGLHAMLERANMVLMVIDGKDGVTAQDEELARQLRRFALPMLLLVNKCDSKKAKAAAYEAYNLGLGEPICISAEHALGLHELHDAIHPFYEMHIASNAATAPSIRVAVVGRPNVGKSTFINKLLKEERVLTGEKAGTTRDSILINWHHKGRDFTLIDTAGMRRRPNVVEKLERMSVKDSLKSISETDIAILLLDAEYPLEKQDLTIASRVIDNGKVLVLVANKWDKVVDAKQKEQEIRSVIDFSMSDVQDVPLIKLSALHDHNLHKVIDKAIEYYDLWQSRIPTARLNTWLEEALSIHSPPMGANGRRVKIKYITQTSSSPPSFLCFTNNIDDIRQDYRKYLINSLRNCFHLPGIPMKLNFKAGKNPYAK